MSRIFLNYLMWFIIYELGCILFGIIQNYVYLPKGSTVQDIINPSKTIVSRNTMIVPLSFFAAPGINAVFVVIGIVDFILTGFCYVGLWLYKVPFIKNTIDKLRNIYAKFKSIKIK